MPFSLLPNPLNYATECPLTPMEAGHSSKNRSALRNPIFSFPIDGQRRLRWVVRRPSSTKKGLLLRKSEIPTAGNSLAQVHNTRDLRIRARWGATRRTTSFAERERATRNNLAKFRTGSPRSPSPNAEADENTQGQSRDRKKRYLSKVQPKQKPTLAAYWLRFLFRYRTFSRKKFVEMVQIYESKISWWKIRTQLSALAVKEALR